MKHPPLPRDMRQAPALDPHRSVGPVTPRTALLINPFYAKDPVASFGKHVLTPSLALTSIAGATPPTWRVRYWDENLLQGPPPVAPFPQVVGITVHLTFARRAYGLARWYRRRGAQVVLGGLHVTTCPEEARPHADALVIGEGVQLWPRLLADVEAGRLQAEYRSGDGLCYDDEPAPARHLVDRACFLTTTSVVASRGCRNRCGFCYLATAGVDGRYQVRDPAHLAAEIAADDQPYFVFTDNNLGASPDYLRRLCAELRPLNRIWSAAVSLDVTDDPDLVYQMARAGCTGVFVGLETLDARNLHRAGKRTPHPRDYARRVRLLHDCAIQVNGSFVFGFDHDGPEVFGRTVDWIEQQRLECATFHILTPYPGTPLYRRLDRQGRLLHRDWTRYDTSHVVFRPRRMTVEQLFAGYAWSYRRLFSAASIWRRRPAQAEAVLPYLGMSVLYKHANPLWRWLIRHRLTQMAWRPLVEATRRRHLKTRRRLAPPRGSRPRRDQQRGSDHVQQQPLSSSLSEAPIPASGVLPPGPRTATGGAAPGDGVLG